MNPDTDELREGPATLSYARDVAPEPKFGSLIGGLLCALFLLIIGLASLIVGSVLTYGAVQNGKPAAVVFGIALVICGLGVFVVGLVQAMATFAAMWNPARAFWWDRWFKPVGEHPEKPDQF